MAGNAAEAGRSVTSKVVSILLAFRHGNEFKITELARLTALPISTAHRLVTELVDAGLLTRTGNRHYRLGRRLGDITGDSAAAPPSLHERARRVIEDLAAACPGGIVRLGVLDGPEVAFIEKPDSFRPVSMVFDAETVPVHATAMGKALLALQATQVVQHIISHGLRAYTPFTITQADELLRQLATTRLTHLALAHQEFELGRFDVAVPVFGPADAVVAALEVSVRRPADIRGVQPALRVAVITLTHELHANPARDSLLIGGKRELDVMLHARAWTCSRHADSTTG